MISKPGSALPRATDIKLAKTENDIMPGIEAGLNQLFARIEGEFRINMFPMALRIEPIKHHDISPYSRRVLSHTPAITRTPPREQPIFIPNLSRIQLAGTAKIGWKIGKNRTLRVTSIGS